MTQAPARILFSLCIFMSSALVQALDWQLDYAQGLIGIQDMNDGWSIADDRGLTTTAARDDLIYLGGLAQYRFNDGPVQWGFEAGGLYTWQNDINYFVYVSGGLTAEISARNDFWNLDLFSGAVLSLRPLQNFRLYAAAGPALALGSLSINEEEVSVAPFEGEGSNLTINLGGRHTTSDFSFYSRAGFDITFNKNLIMGFSARKIDFQLDFGNNGVIALNDVQYMLTFSRRY